MEITLIRRPGLSTHNVLYSVTLRPGVRATYIGAMDAPRIGTYSASIPASDYVDLADYVLQSGFTDYFLCYGPSTTDISTATVSVVVDGKRKTVVDSGETTQEYELEAPPALREICRRLDAFTASATWKLVSRNGDVPYYRPSEAEYNAALNRLWAMQQLSTKLDAYRWLWGGMGI